MKKTLCLLLAVLLLVVSLAGCGKKDDYSEVLLNFSRSLSGDTEALLSLFPPEYPAFMEYIGMDLSSLTEDTDLSETSVSDITYVVNTETPLSKDELSVLNQSRAAFAVEGSDIRVKDATCGYRLSVTFTGQNPEGSVETSDISMVVIYIGGHWYLDISSLEM